MAVGRGAASLAALRYRRMDAKPAAWAPQRCECATSGIRMRSVTP